MASDMQAESTPTSSILDDSQPTIVCYDPDHPDSPCPICGGLGQVRYEVPVSHPRFGKLFRCPNFPVEADRDRRERLRKLSNLDIFAGKTFDTFQTDLVDYSESEAQSLATAFNGALNYAQNPDGWLLLEGSYGCGKTHLAAAVGHQRLLQGDTVLFITTPDLLDHLRSTFSPRSETTYDELFDRVRETDLLILDDLGVENPSEWAKEKLFQLINHRYSRRMSTIVTTNSDIDGLDPRLRSRLLDIEITHIIKIVAPDYRSRRQNERKQVLSRLHMYVNMTTDNFDPHSNLTYDEQQNLRRAMEAALKFGSHPHGWLMFVGGYGTGKTHLAAIIANYRHEKGDEVLFITVADLMDYLRTTFHPNSTHTFDELFNKIRDVTLLVLDDLNTQNSSSWAKEKLFQILDFRYVNRLPTILTSAQEINDIDERIRSRLLDSRVCQNVAIIVPSYALRLKRR